MNTKDAHQTPFLIIAVGNRSRGDDALGPLLLEQLQQAEAMKSDVEFLDDFQLQVEHALDLQHRVAVLFVDAALPGVVESVSLEPVFAEMGTLPASHALRAEAVLNVAHKLNASAPPSWQLAIEGQRFGLGDELSEPARHHLQLAFELATNWLSARRHEHARHASHPSFDNANMPNTPPCMS